MVFILNQYLLEFYCILRLPLAFRFYCNELLSKTMNFYSKGMHSSKFHCLNSKQRYF